MLPDRVALERLGKKRSLSVFASHAEALQNVGPEDVAAGLSAPTEAELAAIAALGPPRRKAQRSARQRSLPPDATLAQRIAEAFRRLEARGILARRGLAGPQSHAWEAIATARTASHRGAIFYVADGWKRAKTTRTLHLHWACWAGASWLEGEAPTALAREVVAVLRDVGVDATTPESETQSLTIRVP